MLVFYVSLLSRDLTSLFVRLLVRQVRGILRKRRLRASIRRDIRRRWAASNTCTTTLPSEIVREFTVCSKTVLTLRRLMSYIYIYIYIYIYGAPILDVSRSHTTTKHSR